MTESKIEWTGRSDWNPVRGCTRVSPGCGGPGPYGGCYAEAMAARFSLSASEVENKWYASAKNDGKTPPAFKDQWGHGFAEMQHGKPRWTGKVELQDDRLTMPLSWRKPGFVFPNSTSDFFHEALPDQAIDKIFAIMARCPHLTFQVLTKRPERMQQYMSRPPRDMATGQEGYLDAINRASMAIDGIPVFPSVQYGMIPHPGWPLPNVWLGTSCERQEEANLRVPHLLQTLAVVLFVSAEPLLGPIDFTGIPNSTGLGEGQRWLNALGVRGAGYVYESDDTCAVRRIDQVIIGGESGPRARPFDVDWARFIISQCEAAGVFAFMKQLGSNPYSDGRPMHAAPRGKYGDPAEWPPELRVRQMPSNA